jgi:hypothetical protein
LGKLKKVFIFYSPSVFGLFGGAEKENFVKTLRFYER